MDSTRVPDQQSENKQSGIALFMVIAAMTILSILVTEFTYIAQVNQRMAYDGLDQLKALYLAKSGFKLSLLRLKAYQQIKKQIGGLSDAAGGGGIPGVPKQLIEKIWNFPFFYPIPTLPGMTEADKDRINAFQKESGLEGRFSAVIESESSKYNLNSILAPFAAPSPSPSPTKTAPPPTPGDESQTPKPGSSFTPEAARDGLKSYLAQVIENKFEADPDFAEEYRDLKIDDLIDQIATWADASYESRVPFGREVIKPKRAPFYSVAELHMLPIMDDNLYDVLAPVLTVSTTPGININTMKEQTLLALAPKLTKEEVDEFFKFRDSDEEDHSFKKEDEFYAYLQEKTGAYGGTGNDAVEALKKDITQKGIRLVTDETNFRIKVQAQMNQASRTLEALVTLSDKADTTGGANPAGAPPRPTTAAPPLSGPGPQEQKTSAGLKVTFMRIL